MYYKIEYEFKFNYCSWASDCLTNNGDGFTRIDAYDIAEQLKHNEYCKIRNVVVKPLIEEKG